MKRLVAQAASRFVITGKERRQQKTVVRGVCIRPFQAFSSIHRAHQPQQGGAIFSEPSNLLFVRFGVSIST